MKTAYILVSEVIEELKARECIRSEEDITMQVISVCNQKGGVGKTTTSFCLTAGLIEEGYKCLLIDLEGQRNLTATIGGSEEGATISEVLTGEAPIKDAVISTQAGDFIRGDKSLAVIDNALTEADKYSKLKEALKPIKRGYDFIIIDTPPSLGTLTLNALIASDYVIVPCLSDLYSSYGLMDLSETIDTVKKRANTKLRVLGVLLTMYDKRTRLSKEMTETLESITGAFKTTLFNTTIRASVKAKELQLHPEGLFKYAPRHPLTEDYRQFTQEVLKKLKD